MRFVVQHVDRTASHGVLQDVTDETGQVFFPQGTPVVITPAPEHGSHDASHFTLRIQERSFDVVRERATDDTSPVRIYHTSNS